MKDFDSIIKETRLVDTNLNNVEFTWSNMRERLACSRIDRFLFTEGWGELWQSVRQEAVTRVTSDHWPITLDTNNFKWGPTPFRFENMWLQDKSFKTQFGEWWSNSEAHGWEGFKFMRRLELVKYEVKAWNKSNFGDVRLEKNAVVNRIEELDKKEYGSDLNDNDRDERKFLRSRLGELIVREEISWNQKTKTKNVIEWDNNSRLFHRVASGRKANKLINKIETINGAVLQTEAEIESEILNFFEELYNKKKSKEFGLQGLNWARISVSSSREIEKPFEEEEVKEALFRCDGDKAPGPDGFTMAALQDGWEIIKEDVMKVFGEFYENGVINAKTNATFICLIPKKINSIFIKDFRPISLVSSLYKLIAKTLSLRLRKVLDETIDITQGAFVHGRQILDSVLIANEAVEEYRAKKKKGVVFKIDFEKAFDHVSWEFLEHVLVMKGFGSRWVKWIDGCLTSANFSVIINGKPRVLFGAARGLRQGDSLSPFLFIIVADILSRLMKKANESNLIRGFQVEHDKVNVSLLQFADDSIFFLEDCDVNLQNLVGLLDIFSLVSGLKINMSKSTVAGINIEEGRVSFLASVLGCSTGSWPMNYLGLPLGGNPNSLSFWNPVIERVSKRVEGWYKGCLSRGGRLTLLHSVLSSIPIYFLSIFKIPVKPAMILEKIMRDFFWEGSGEGHGVHLVSWEVASKAKEFGGIGIGNIINRNNALLGKWLWRFPLESDSLWHAVIASKYGYHVNGWDAKENLNATLRAPWKSVSKVWDAFHANILPVVGRGDRIQFWEDKWVNELPLKIKFPSLFRLSRNKDDRIASVLSWQSDLSFSWNLTFVRNLNDWEVNDFVELMNCIESAIVKKNVSDKRAWAVGSSGEFTCKSFFQQLCQIPSDGLFDQHKFIWKGGVPSKIRVFAWLAALGKVNTCDSMQARRPSMCLSPSWCVLCKNSLEDINHILLHCPFVRSIWANIFQLFSMNGVCPRTWAEFTKIRWPFKAAKKVYKCLWRFAVLACAWLVWLERNKRLFEDKLSHPKQIWSHIKFLIGLWARSSKLFSNLDNYLFNLDAFSFIHDAPR